MPPKKRSKSGPSGEGESSSSAPFDRRRFWDAKAAEYYTALQEKSMQRERGMDQSYPDCTTLVLARELNWGEFVKPPADAVLSLVREFYANLKVKHEEYHVKVRGKMVAFDSKTINGLYSMPDYDIDEYTIFIGEPYPYEAIINTLCKPGTVWKLNNQRAPVTFPATSMKKEAHNWYHFVASRMMPSGHVSDVTKARAALVYCILTGKTVDAGQLIMYSILQAARGTSTFSMPHSSTITDLCHVAGVTWDDSEQLLQTKGDIIVFSQSTGVPRRRQTSSRGEASGSGVQAPPQPQPQPQPQPTVQAPPVPNDMFQSVQERLDGLERMMRMQWQITREQFDYVHDFNAVLARRFPASSATDEPFPPPPSWSHQPVEDDYEYDDDEEQDVDSESRRSLHEVMQFVESPEYCRFSRIVFDTAPTGHTLRLLLLPDFFAASVGKMMRLKKKIASATAALKSVLGKGEPQQDATDKIEQLKERMEKVRDLFRNSETTEFVIVMIPTVMALRESSRLCASLLKEKVPVRRLVVNQLLPQSASDCKFCAMKTKDQNRVLDMIPKDPELAKLTLIQSHLMDVEIRGIPALKFMGDMVWR